MEYLTQFKKFLKTNNGSDTHLPAQSWRTLLQLSFQPCTARLRAHTHTRTAKHILLHRRNIDTLVVYGNCVMTVNDGTTPT